MARRAFRPARTLVICLIGASLARFVGAQESSASSSTETWPSPSALAAAVGSFEPELTTAATTTAAVAWRCMNVTLSATATASDSSSTAAVVTETCFPVMLAQPTPSATLEASITPSWTDSLSLTPSMSLSLSWSLDETTTETPTPTTSTPSMTTSEATFSLTESLVPSETMWETVESSPTLSFSLTLSANWTSWTPTATQPSLSLTPETSSTTSETETPSSTSETPTPTPTPTETQTETQTTETVTPTSTESQTESQTMSATSETATQSSSTTEWTSSFTETTTSTETPTPTIDGPKPQRSPSATDAAPAATPFPINPSFLVPVPPGSELAIFLAGDKGLSCSSSAHPACKLAKPDRFRVACGAVSSSGDCLSFALQVGSGCLAARTDGELEISACPSANGKRIRRNFPVSQRTASVAHWALYLADPAKSWNTTRMLMNAGKTLGGTPTCLVHSQDGNQTGVFTGACRVAPSSGLSSTFVIPLPGESLPAGIEEPKSSNVGVILGASLGALICVSGVVLGFAWYIRRKKVLKERFELIDMEDKPGLSPISVTSERTLASPVSPPASEGGWHHAAPTFPRALSPVTPTTALGSPSTDFADLYRSPPGLPLPFDPRPIPTELHYSAANGQVTVSSGSPLSEYFPPASGPIAAERTVVSLGLPWTDGVEATRPAEIEGEDDKVSRNSVEIPRNSLDGRSEAEDIFADPSEAELEDDDDVAVKIPAGYGVEALDEEDDRDVELATSSMVAASARSSLEKRIV